MGDMERQIFMDQIIEHVDSPCQGDHEGHVSQMTSHMGDDSEHQEDHDHDHEENLSNGENDRLGKYMAKMYI